MWRYGRHKQLIKFCVSLWSINAQRRYFESLYTCSGWRWTKVQRPGKTETWQKFKSGKFPRWSVWTVLLIVNEWSRVRNCRIQHLMSWMKQRKPCECHAAEQSHGGDFRHSRHRNFLTLLCFGSAGLRHHKALRNERGSAVPWHSLILRKQRRLEKLHLDPTDLWTGF